MDLNGTCASICWASAADGLVKHVAIQLAKMDKRLMIVTRELLVGSVCLVTGTIPSKTFRAAVEIVRRVRRTD